MLGFLMAMIWDTFWWRLDRDLLGLIAGNFESNSIGLLDGVMLELFLNGELGLLLDDMFVLLKNKVLGLFV